MVISFEFKDKIIAKADLFSIPYEEEVVRIYNKDYEVAHTRHEVEIKLKPSGKKVVIEKAICTILKLKE